jgi:hypothetical protein
MVMATCVFGLFALASAHSAEVQHTGEKHALRAAPLIHKETFKRKLVACNTFPDEAPVSITQNRHHHVEDNLRYKECKTINTKLVEGDQLVFESKSAGTWTFQVGALPESDSTMLLVFEKRDDTSKVPSFQSFAFPPSSEDAQLAVIDAFKGKAERTRVHLMDAAPNHNRAEDLDYDRVYALEDGEYDLSMLIGENATNPHASRLHMSKGGDYVALRLGGSGYSHDYQEELVTFALVDTSFAPVAVCAALFAIFA